MQRNISKSRENILIKSEKAKQNYSAAKANLADVRENIDFYETKLDEEIEDLDKGIKIFEAIPDEELLNPSPGLYSAMASGSDIANNMYEHSKYYKNRVEQFGIDISALNASTTVVDASGNSLVDISRFTWKRVIARYPAVADLHRELELPTKHGKRNKLEDELRKIDERFANMFVGAWQTLKDESKQDRWRQASHSMRDLLSQFLDFLAPPDEVRKAEWYSTEHKSSKPTQRQRAKYAIVGKRSETLLNEIDLKMIDVLMNDTRKAYNDLSGIAHARNEEAIDFTESYMERCEEVISAILDLRKRFSPD